MIDYLKNTWLSGIKGLNTALESKYGVMINEAIIEPATSPDGNTPAFTAAVDGTEQKPEGEDGKFDFLVMVPSAGGNPKLITPKTCVIKAKQYTAPMPDPTKEAPQINAKGNTAALKEGVVTVIKGNIVTLSPALPNNVANHTLQ